MLAAWMMVLVDHVLQHNSSDNYQTIISIIIRLVDALFGVVQNTLGTELLRDCQEIHRVTVNINDFISLVTEAVWRVDGGFLSIVYNTIN